MATLSKTTLKKIMGVLSKRYLNNFQKPMTVTQQKRLSKKLIQSFNENRLSIDVSVERKINYFFQFEKTFMGEFREHFFEVTDFYCNEDKDVRKKCFKAMRAAAQKMKKNEAVKKMAINVSIEDSSSISHFAKIGVLTFIELIGNVSESIKLLEKDVSIKAPIKISKMKASEINKLIELDLKSHMQDKSSRMREIFLKPNAKKQMKAFYQGLFKRKSMIVVKYKNNLAGNIGFFVDDKNKLGLIACIFVANKYQGLGLSKKLYKAVLAEFKKRKLKHYIGGTTTKGVLAVADKIGRRPSKHVYLVKI